MHSAPGLQSEFYPPSALHSGLKSAICSRQSAICSRQSTFYTDRQSFGQLFKFVSAWNDAQHAALFHISVLNRNWRKIRLKERSPVPSFSRFFEVKYPLSIEMLFFDHY